MLIQLRKDLILRQADNTIYGLTLDFSQLHEMGLDPEEWFKFDRKMAPYPADKV